MTYETSHPAIVAEVRGPGYVGMVWSRERDRAHAAECREWAEVEVWPSKYAFIVSFGLNPQAVDPQCPHDRQLMVSDYRERGCNRESDAITQLREWEREARNDG